MTRTVQANGKARWGGWRIAGWSFAAALLALPLIAMQFTSEVNWNETDFIFAGLLIGSVGLGFEFIVRKSGSIAYRLGAAVALIAAFLTVWANAAVGMIGSDDNPFNLWFGLVPLIALVGSLLVRFEGKGMMWTMVSAALAQALIGSLGLSTDVRGALLSIGFAGLWLFAAALFWSSAHGSTPTVRS